MHTWRKYSKDEKSNLLIIVYFKKNKIGKGKQEKERCMILSTHNKLKFLSMMFREHERMEVGSFSFYQLLLYYFFSFYII